MIDGFAKVCILPKMYFCNQQLNITEDLPNIKQTNTPYMRCNVCSVVFSLSFSHFSMGTSTILPPLFFEWSEYDTSHTQHYTLYNINPECCCYTSCTRANVSINCSYILLPQSASIAFLCLEVHCSGLMLL